MPCADLDAELRFFTERLGMRVAAVFPADAPRETVIEGHGLRLRLDSTVELRPVVVRVACEGVPVERDVTTPNGNEIEFVRFPRPDSGQTLRPAFVLSRVRDAVWGVGRAGMRYRDLLPCRLGGAVIASHIHIPTGGPVPDYVHFHRVRFQMIFCHRGWVRVVYEDQGESFVMRPGDLVLQPPQIRHRVLECSDDVHVIEVSVPSEHETWADPDFTLPSPTLRPEREFEGQRFVRSEAATAEFEASTTEPGRVARVTGVFEATQGLALVHVVRPAAGPHPQRKHTFLVNVVFVLAGRAELRLGEGGRDVHALQEGDAYAMPPDERHELRPLSDDFEILDVMINDKFRVEG